MDIARCNKITRKRRCSVHTALAVIVGPFGDDLRPELEHRRRTLITSYKWIYGSMDWSIGIGTSSMRRVDINPASYPRFWLHQPSTIVQSGKEKLNGFPHVSQAFLALGDPHAIESTPDCVLPCISELVDVMVKLLCCRLLESLHCVMIVGRIPCTVTPCCRASRRNEIDQSWFELGGGGAPSRPGCSSWGSTSGATQGWLLRVSEGRAGLVPFWFVCWRVFVDCIVII